MFKLQSLSKYSPFDVIHLLRCFSIAQNSFWTCQFWCLSVLLPFLSSHLFHVDKTFSSEDFFHPWKQQKVTWGETAWIGRVGHRGSAVFGQKLLNIQHSVGRCAHKSLIMKWETLKESSKKNSLKPNEASHNNTSWYTDTDGFLEHSPSGGSLYYKGPTLQKIIEVLRGVPPCVFKKKVSQEFMPSLVIFHTFL